MIPTPGKVVFESIDLTSKATPIRIPLGNGTRDSVVLTTLPPGAYTAQISGVGNTTGVALVEIHVLP